MASSPALLFVLSFSLVNKCLKSNCKVNIVSVLCFLTSSHSLGCDCHQHASSQPTEEHGQPSEGPQGRGAVYLLLFFPLEILFVLSAIHCWKSHLPSSKQVAVLGAFGSHKPQCHSNMALYAEV